MTQSTQPSGWKPILEGSLGERALRCVEGIAADLMELTHTEPETNIGFVDASLGRGDAGLAIFFYYLWLHTGSEEHRAEASRVLDRAITAIAEQQMPPSLYMGFPGVAWAAAHLEGRLFDSSGEDPNAEIDQVLAEYLDTSPWTGDYDLISGLVGLGVYSLERLPRPIAVTCLGRVVERLSELAHQDGDGYSWWTDPTFLPEETRRNYPHGYFNLGVAHGVPAVVWLLAQAERGGIDGIRVLDGAVGWLIAQKLASDAEGSFPIYKGEKVPARLAWCYGDAGVAAALATAGAATNRKDWELEAMAIATKAGSRDPDRTGIRDTPICHGSAGLGHLFNRLYQTYGEANMRSAALSWFEHTIQSRNPSFGIGGFPAWKAEEGKMTWENEPGLLAGAAGVGLALLAGATRWEPAWDTILVCNP